MLGQQLDTILYHVLPGDNLSRIISRYYGPVSPQRRQAIIQQIKADNPKVKNPDHIVPNQLLFIDIPPQYCAAPSEERATPVLSIAKYQLKPLQQQWNMANPKERDMLSSLAPIMLGSGGANLVALKTNFQVNAPLLQDIIQHYEDYKAKKITKGQYDYRKRVAINKIEANLGPFKYLLSRNRRHHHILRISRTKGRAPTVNISRQIGRMGKLARVASRGGVFLSVAGLGLTCHDIANADTKLGKNEILVESLGGLGGGILTSAAILIMFTPVGWVAALAVGVSSVVGGYILGNAAKNVYSAELNRFDIASMTGIAQLCKK